MSDSSEHRTTRQCSRVDYKARYGPSGNAFTYQINTGSLQRIADATEKMAKSYTDMERSRDQWRCWYDKEEARRHRAYRRLSATRGVVTKLKRERDTLRAQVDAALELCDLLTDEAAKLREAVR